MTDLFERAAQWIAHDPDAATRAELKELVERARKDDAARAQLAERFIGPLEFGTAGLRGIIGAGESLMNRAVVRRTSAGLARYLLAQRAPSGARSPEGASSTDSGPISGPASVRTAGVVIGYDGRRLSREFAEDTAAVLSAHGIPSFLATHPVPTPVTAYAVTRLRAAAGVMVTASHNPPEYNGYKVYWSNGAQIIPPHDQGIAAAIAEQPPADEVKLLDLAMAREKNLLADWPADLEPTYLAAIAKLGRRKDGDRSFPIVYTALHGVGNRLVMKAMADAGFSHVRSVAEQAEPDGAFPTVRFPNPEEKGALDLSYALADKEKADLIIANDPDVDRLAVAVRNKDGKWQQLTGNEVGTLLGHYLLTEGQDAAGDGERPPSSRAPSSVQDDRLVLASCVSSPMLGAICRELGVRYEETLTGFKWIANRAMELERTRGARFVFGYEEALGYTVGPLVRDKDGISAALVVAELAAVRRMRGESLLDEVASLARRYGAYISGQRAITMPGSDGLAKIGAIMTRLRQSPPEAVGGLKVAAVSDYETQKRRESASGKESALSLPKTNMLALDLEGGSRIIARPSGTEPKIKFYFDLREEVPEGESAATATTRAQEKLARLADDFVRLAGA